MKHPNKTKRQHEITNTDISFPILDEHWSVIKQIISKSFPGMRNTEENSDLLIQVISGTINKTPIVNEHMNAHIKRLKNKT